MAIEGPVVNWVADHRKHHAHTDVDGDPHSPHGHGSGLAGTIKGLWHAHVGWLWDDHGIAERTKYARDLVEDRGMRIINLSFGPLVALSLAIPFFLGLAIGGTLQAGLTAFLWGGLVRVSSCTTSRGRSTRSATSSAAVASPPPISPRTSSGWRCRASARPGTTTITRSRARPSTGCASARSTSRGGSSWSSRSSGWSGTSCVSRPSAKRRRSQSEQHRFLLKLRLQRLNP